MAIIAVSAALGYGRLIALSFVLRATVAITATGLISYSMLFYLCGIIYIILFINVRYGVLLKNSEEA